MGRGSSTSVPLLEEAPWLCQGLEPASAEDAKRALLVPVATHEPGAWAPDAPHPAVGWLILSGRMARGLHVDDAPAHGFELLGAADLVRHWTFDGGAGSVPSKADWHVLAPVRLAVLDLAYVRATMRWPRIGINLLDCTVERSRTLSYFLTARQVTRLEARLLLTLWALADRWGHTSSGGVVVELPKLTHEMIGRMIAARRPSVTTALKHLRDLGLVETEANGRWVLHGDPVESLHTVRKHVPEPPEQPHPSPELG